MADGGAQHTDEPLQQPDQQPVQPWRGPRHLLERLLEQPAGPERQAGQHLHRQLPGHAGG